MNLDQRVNNSEHARQSQQVGAGPRMSPRGYKPPTAITSYGKPTGLGQKGTSESTQAFWSLGEKKESSEGRNVHHTKYLPHGLDQSIKPSVILFPAHLPTQLAKL